MPDVARLGRDVGGGSWRGLVVHLAGIPVCLHPFTHTYVLVLLLCLLSLSPGPCILLLGLPDWLALQEPDPS